MGTVDIFSLILYRLSVLLLRAQLLALEWFLFLLLQKESMSIVCPQVCFQRHCNGSLPIPDLAYPKAGVPVSISDKGFSVEKIRDAFSKLNSQLEAEERHKPWVEALYLRESRRALRELPRSSDISRPRKILYRAVVEESASDSLEEWLSFSLEEIHSQWSWAQWLSYLNNPEFSLIWRSAQNALPFAGGL